MFWIATVAVIFLLGGIYLKLCKLLDGIQDIKNLMKEMSNYLVSDDSDMTASKIGLKALIANRCLEIENEIVRLRYGVFGGERIPSLDKINILDTLVDIKASMEKEA